MVEESCVRGVDRVDDGWFHRVAVMGDDVSLVTDRELPGRGIDTG